MVPTEPPMPRPTGGELKPVEVTKPASTSPMKAMNRPMPTVIAIFSWIGTASKMSTRRLVAERITMMTPLMSTRPIASDQVRSPTTRCGEERVDAEAGREGERQLGDEPEQDRHHAGGEGRDGGDLGESERVAAAHPCRRSG